MRVAAIVGESGSGKTTLIVALIRHFVTAGQRVGAIKHTHHPLNNESRGDTAAFETAGAAPVIFAGDEEALAGGKRIRFETPRDLLDHIDADIVFVEGFKRFEAWPRIELDRNGRISVEDALAILDRMWASK
jgi:molybdopterin-guanine dinucleotide biosynthesis protein MobB